MKINFYTVCNECLDKTLVIWQHFLIFIHSVFKEFLKFFQEIDDNHVFAKFCDLLHYYECFFEYKVEKVLGFVVNITMLNLKEELRNSQIDHEKRFVLIEFCENMA